MVQSQQSKNKSINIVAPLILALYLSIGFIPNWEAVDRIAPQWLVMSFVNLISVSFFIYHRKSLKREIALNFKSSLTLIYLGFIIWAVGSLAYAINPTEVLVNISRQFNVFLMYFSMVIISFRFKNKLRFLPWIITFILVIEIYAVLLDAVEILKNQGFLEGGKLKGVTANRNITAFSIAIKIPFLLYLIHINKKVWIRLMASILIPFR